MLVEYLYDIVFYRMGGELLLKRKEKKNCSNIDKMKEDIHQLSKIDKSLIPEYLDDMKKDLQTKPKEITKKNPYYKFL